MQVLSCFLSSEDTLVVIGEGKVGDDWPKEGEIWSRRQAEMFLSQQGAYIIGDFKEALDPQELERIIRAILHSHPTLADAVSDHLSYNRVIYMPICQSSIPNTCWWSFIMTCFSLQLQSVLKDSSEEPHGDIFNPFVNDWFLSWGESRSHWRSGSLANKRHGK